MVCGPRGGVAGPAGPPRPDHFSAGCWSEDETTGPGVPRKLVFVLHVRVSRNRSRSFIPPPRASRNASGASLRLPRVLHFRASPPTAKRAKMAL